MRQALNLVADTFYAIVLPSKGIRTLEVYVESGRPQRQRRRRSLDGGDRGWTCFWVSGPQRGLPVSVDVGIIIDENELEDTHYRTPLYKLLGALVHGPDARSVTRP